MGHELLMHLASLIMCFLAHVRLLGELLSSVFWNGVALKRKVVCFLSGGASDQVLHKTISYDAMGITIQTWKGSLLQRCAHVLTAARVGRSRCRHHRHIARKLSCGPDAPGGPSLAPLLKCDEGKVPCMRNEKVEAGLRDSAEACHEMTMCST
eukprot:3825324-Amphidinium_carterae.1